MAMLCTYIDNIDICQHVCNIINENSLNDELVINSHMYNVYIMFEKKRFIYILSNKHHHFPQNTQC